jgi:hypothetical protein
LILAYVFVAVILLAYFLCLRLPSAIPVLYSGYMGIAISAAVFFLWLILHRSDDGALGLQTIRAFIQLVLIEGAWTIGWMVGVVRLFFLEEKPVLR